LRKHIHPNGATSFLFIACGVSELGPGDSKWGSPCHSNWKHYIVQVTFMSVSIPFWRVEPSSRPKTLSKRHQYKWQLSIHFFITKFLNLFLSFLCIKKNGFRHHSKLEPLKEKKEWQVKRVVCIYVRLLDSKQNNIRIKKKKQRCLDLTEWKSCILFHPSVLHTWKHQI